MAITLTFQGAAEGVTGSRYLLEAGKRRVLVDCGLFQGRRSEARERNLAQPCDPRSIDAVVLTHAHIDHSGMLPILPKGGFRGPIVCTNATADLASIMLRDSAQIQMKDVEYLNERKEREWRSQGRQGRAPDLIEPFYELEDAVACDALYRGVSYHETTQVLPGITVSFTDQGHILGAAAALLTVVDGDRTLKIVFGGDRGRKDQPILKDPEPYPDCDVLVTESTYGGKSHPKVEEIYADLERIVKRTLDLKAKLVIPAFSVGRTQNVLYYLNELMCEGTIPRFDVFVDSPLSSRATKVYAAHPECFDEATIKFLHSACNPLSFPGLAYVETYEESIAINDHPGPCIIISASGMCENGRVLHHLRHTLGDERNTVMLVGYMAENTLGRRLRDGEKLVRIHDRHFTVRAKIEVFQGLSAHADREDLLDSTAHLVGRVKTIFCVHGEKDALEAMRSGVAAQGHKDVRIARWHETVAL